MDRDDTASRPRRGRPARDAAPRIFIRRGAYAADLRRWALGRPTLRDPDAAGWPEAGETTTDEEVALRWALRYVDRQREGRRRAHLGLGPAARRLGPAVDEYLSRRRDNTPTATFHATRSALHALRRWAASDRETGRRGDDLRTDRLTAPALARWIEALRAAGYAHNTRTGYLASAAGFLASLGYEGPDNPARRVRIEPEPRAEIEVWSDEDLGRLRAAADRIDAEGGRFRRYRLAVELALATGCRRNELFALDWRAFDPAARTVRVSRQLHKTERGRFVPPKSRRPRTALVLPGWWARHDPAGRGLVLPADDGAPVPPGSLRWMFARLLAEAGIERPGTGWHLFRHTYARDFIVGVRGDFGLLRSSLGHASMVTTERAYGHLHDDTAASLARSRIYPDERLRIV